MPFNSWRVNSEVMNPGGQNTSRSEMRRDAIADWSSDDAPAVLRDMSADDLVAVERVARRRGDRAGDCGDYALEEWYDDIATDVRAERRRRGL
jgi:hypothetical protein